MTQTLRATITLTDDEMREFKRRTVSNGDRYMAGRLRQAIRLMLHVERATAAGDRLEIVHADGTRQRLVIIV